MESALRQRQWPLCTAGVLLSLLPPVSFFLQYVLSVQSGSVSHLFQHLTVTYVDWIFIPFNFVVVRVIDWRRGSAIFLIVIVSVIANIAGHAIWQCHGTDGGHMISPEQIVLPAGWVHLGFSIIETVLIFTFVFAPKPSEPSKTIATALALMYFVGAGVSGYVMNHGIIASDAIMVTSGVVLVACSSVFNARRPTTAAGEEVTKAV